MNFIQDTTLTELLLAMKALKEAKKKVEELTNTVSSKQEKLIKLFIEGEDEDYEFLILDMDKLKKARGI